MGKIRPFEIALIAIFAIAGIIGLVFLANIKTGSEEEVKIYGNEVKVWGTTNAEQFTAALQEIGATDTEFSAAVKYRQFDERSFENEIVNAIAEGNPPDLVLMPHDLLVSLRAKLRVIPFETMPQSSFRTTYIDGAEIFMLSDGIYGIPIGVDPLLLYYNRDLLANNGMAIPPKTWETLLNDAIPRLTKTDSRRNLVESAIGMGEYMNIRNAKEILSLLFLQAGTSIIQEADKRYQVTLVGSNSEGRGQPPAQAALNFYTQFASPNSNAFTWSRSMQQDRNAFIAGKLAMYIGFQSERKAIEDGNPNLDIGIAKIPQAEGATALRNYGKFYAFGIIKSSKNVNGAYTAAMKMALQTSVVPINQALDITPALRSLYGTTKDDLYGTLFDESALISRGWLDPAPSETDGIFKSLIEDVTFGRGDALDSIREATYALEELFR